MQITRDYLVGLMRSLQAQERAALDKAAGARGAIQSVQHLIDHCDMREQTPEPEAETT